jgi:hypothetical protein
MYALDIVGRSTKTLLTVAANQARWNDLSTVLILCTKNVSPHLCSVCLHWLLTKFFFSKVVFPSQIAGAARFGAAAVVGVLWVTHPYGVMFHLFRS